MGLWKSWNDKHNEVVNQKKTNKDNIAKLKADNAKKIGDYWFDDVEQILYKQGKLSDLNFQFIPYQEIIGYEPNIEGAEQTKKHGITRAVVGGIIAGGAGSIVGAVTGGKQFKEISKIEVIVQVSNYEKYHIVIQDAKFKSDSFVSKANLKILEEATVLLDRIIGTYQSNNQQPTQAQYSTADELMKLKQLYDQGIINDEEFQNEKAKLLNN